MSDEPLDIEKSALLHKMNSEIRQLKQRIENLEDEGDDIAEDVYSVLEQNANITNVTFKNGRILFDLSDDRIVSVPLWWSWKLEAAEKGERQNYMISDEKNRVVWPELSEEISVLGVLTGDPAPRPEDDSE
jgi:hypothetical protein